MLFRLLNKYGVNHKMYRFAGSLAFLLIKHRVERRFFVRYNFESVNLDVSFKVSLLNLTASWVGLGNVPVFKTMRTLRGLRPLRALSRMQSMKVIIAYLITTNHINSSIPSQLTFTSLNKRYNYTTLHSVIQRYNYYNDS